MSQVPVFSLLAIAIWATPTWAQSLPQTDPVVVTASRLPQARSETLAAITVLERKDIEASASQDVLELLRRVPGVDLARGGGIGQQASLFIRGTNSNHALVLIDGIRVSALGTGAYAWEHLPIAQIERIEIVRGPRAALWGADALGGVIQIFTRRDTRPWADWQVGYHDTYGLDAGVGHRGARGSFGVSVGWLETRGQNATRPDNFSFDPDRDGALLRNASVHGELELGRQHLALRATHTDDEIDFDQGESRTRQDVQSLTLSGELGSNWQHALTLGANRDRLDTPAFFTAYRSRRQQADWVNTLSPSQNDQVTLGLSWLEERGTQIETFGNTFDYQRSRQNRSLFAGWQHRTQAQTLELSGRHDDNSAYGNRSSLAAAWGLNLGQSTRLTLAWGQGFRAPTMNELYSPGYGGWYAGNPDLTAERSHNVELGLRYGADTASTWELRVYRNDVDGLIDFGGPQAMAVNIAQARIDGAELEWRWQGEVWSLTANATWQDAKDRLTDTALLRRPPRKATALIERVFASGVRLGLETTAVSQRPDYGDVRLGGYGLVAARARLPLTSAWSLDARVENLFNRDYTLVDGYHTPGTTALLTVRWQAP